MNRSDSTRNSSLDDRELLVRIAARDRSALRSLYQRYARRIQRFAARMTHDDGVAEEIVDDTFLAVWDGAARFRGDSQPSTWLFGIAYRRALKALEYRSARLPLALPSQATTNERSRADVANDSTDAEIIDWVEAGLATLSDEHRAVLELTYYLGLSCEEVAHVLQCPLGTVKSRLFHARERLRNALVAADAPTVQQPPATEH
jgi:RNA polymerase sigma-70 factor (ECF subfamily)